MDHVEEDSFRVNAALILPSSQLWGCLGKGVYDKGF